MHTVSLSRENNKSYGKTTKSVWLKFDRTKLYKLKCFGKREILRFFFFFFFWGEEKQVKTEDSL